MSFQRALDEHFPGAVPEADFVSKTYQALEARGFDGPNGFACVGVCRDELCRPLVARLEEAWGEAFNFSSLAGMLFLGKTGFLAAQNHAPIVGGRERYVFLTFAHIGISADGEVGKCIREGREEVSSACGALVGFHAEMTDGHLRLELDRDDMEQSLLKQRLIRRIRFGEVPSLLTLTRHCHAAIVEDLERMVGRTVHVDIADYAVLTGIQVHGPDGDYVWPGTLYAVINGERVPVSIR